jgi:hypothetical protein
MNAVAALALLVYDILLTTDEEVQLIWPYAVHALIRVPPLICSYRKRLSYTKVLYFFIRYFPVPVLMYVSPTSVTNIQLITKYSSILFVGTELTPQFHFTSYDCYLWQVWQGLAALLVAASLDIVLVLRSMFSLHRSTQLPESTAI